MDEGLEAMTGDLALGRNLYDCCEHCEHGINDPPHTDPCPEGCNDAEATP